MTRRICAITFIYVCTVLGWMILAGTMFVRTESQNDRLRSAVGQLWGTPQTQLQLMVYYNPSGGGRIAKEAARLVSLEASEIEVDLKLKHRKKGLLWYSTYQVQFAGSYRIVNPDSRPHQMFVEFMFPSQQAVYDNFQFLMNDKQVREIDLSSGQIVQSVQLEPGETADIQITYKTQGLDQWHYHFGANVNQIRNFSLVLNTDFEQIDFPQRSISPTNKQKTNTGWRLTWQYENLLTGVNIGIILPQKLNPGPWAAQVTGAAPVSLFLFFFLLFVFTTIKKIKIHPINFFFLGTAFFSFHLLLAYLVDHVSIHAAFWICSAVSIFLLVSYMRLVVGARLAFVEIAISQFVYLVLFSYTFFFKGFTGLAITVLCICTLFIVMQFTGKVDWEKVFEKAPRPVSQTTQPLKGPHKE